MSAVMAGERPPRPADPTFVDSLWALAQQCWNQDARLRPHALQVLRSL